MTIIRRLIEGARTEERGPNFSDRLNDLIRSDGRLSSYAAGQTVTTTTARQLMAVWRCQHLLADMISGLPIQQFRRLPDGQREEMERSPFLREPSANVDGTEEWRYQMVLSGTSGGNGYAYITKFDPTFRYAERAEVLAPGDVTVEQRGGALAPPVYKVGRKPVDAERIIHLRAYGPAPGSVLGLSPIEHAAQTIGFGLAGRAYAGRWYEGGGHPTALYSADQPLEDGEIEAIKARHRNAVQNDGVLVTGKTFTYQSLQVTPEAAAFLEAQSATAIDIAGYFGLPPELLGYSAEGSSVTYANREQRALDLLIFTVQWWVGRLERIFSRQLPPDQFAKINIDALLRSDTLTRYQTHDIAIRSGLASRDERRRLEELAPLTDGTGGDHLWPPYSTAPSPAE